MKKFAVLSKIDAMTPSCMGATTPSCTGATTPGCMNAMDNIIRAYNVIYFNFNNTKKTMGNLSNPSTLFAPPSDFRKKAVAAM